MERQARLRDTAILDGWNGLRMELNEHVIPLNGVGNVHINTLNLISLLCKTIQCRAYLACYQRMSHLGSNQISNQILSTETRTDQGWVCG